MRLGLSVGNRGQVLDLLLAHAADVAFGGRPPADERLRAHAFRPNELVLITAADDPLAAGTTVAPAQLGGRTVDEALETGIDPRAVWRAVCEEYDVPPARR